MSAPTFVPDPAHRSAILGLGSYRASRVVPNAELVNRIDSSDEWIQQRSGIVERRCATPEESVVAMATHAAHDALADAGVEPYQVDAIILATVSHMLQTPSAAVFVAHELGAGAVAAFDISAACAGFCYGLELASSMVRGGTATQVLVIGVERLSDITDRGSAFIFADGAGAVVVGRSEEQLIGPTVWGSNGEKTDLIRQREDSRDVIASPTPRMPHLAMQGNAVFRWAAFAMAKVASKTLEHSGLSVEDIDVFVPHQANARITEAMVRALKLPPTVRVAHDITHQGNTSAASIPLALQAMRQSGETKPGDVALLIAFGAGLVYAAQVVVLP